MDKSKQISHQATDSDTTPIKFWGNIAIAMLGILANVMVLWNVLQLPETTISYLAMVFYVLVILAGFAVIILTLRGHQKSGAQLAFYATVVLFASGPFFYTGRALTASISLLLVSAITISQLLPKELRRRSIVITGVALMAMWVTDWITPSWRLPIGTASGVGLAASIVFALILAVIVIRQAWSGNIRVKIVTSYTVIALISVAIIGSVVYVSYRNQIRQDIRQRLLNIISITALQQDGDLFASIQTAEDMQRDAYQKMESVNHAILATDRDLAYIFSVRVDEQEKMVFVVDSGLEDGYVPLDVGVVYDDPSALLAENALTLDHPVVEEDFYTDEYGTFLSAYAPIYKSDGSRAGIVGVDILADKVLAQERAVLFQILGTTLGTMFLVTLIGLWLGNTFAAPVINLVRTTQKIIEGDLNARARVETADEVGDLAKAFNIMTSQLQATQHGLEQRVADRTRDLETVAEVGTATATILESKKLLQEVVDLTKERFNLYHAHIYLLDDEGKNLVLAAGAGEPGRIMTAEGRSIPLDQEQSLVARAARERKGVAVNDVTQAPDFLPNPLLPDTRAELAVPMIVGENVIGVFDLQSDKVRPLTDAEASVATALASLVSTSIQNVRTFEHSRKQAELESLVNAIGQKIQRATSMEETLKIGIREVGLALDAPEVSASISSRREDRGNLTGTN